MESKIASLESNCLTEVQNLVRNVDILKQELINSQRELESLKEYSRQMEKKREEEKLQILVPHYTFYTVLTCCISYMCDAISMHATVTVHR